MNYLWQEFNIKTFPAETIVFKDGVFMPELGTWQQGPGTDNLIKIDKFFDKPIHIIYVGEIIGENNINIEIQSPIPGPQSPNVFLTIKTTNKKPAFFNIFIKNTGKNSKITANIAAQNYSELKINVKSTQNAENTGFFAKNRIIAHKNSKTVLIFRSFIEKGRENCESNIDLSVLADETAKIEFEPAQFISAAPKSAEHSAALYKPTAPQIEFLRTAGLSANEITKVLQEAFLN